MHLGLLLKEAVCCQSYGALTCFMYIARAGWWFRGQAKNMTQQNPWLSFLCAYLALTFAPATTVVKAMHNLACCRQISCFQNPIPHVKWVYWIKVIKEELMHLWSSMQGLRYMRKLNVTRIARSFNLHIYQVHFEQTG